MPRSRDARAGALRAQVAALGLLGLGYPQELGGTPAPFALRNALATTMARASASGGLMAGLFSLNIGLPPVLRHGSAQVQQEVIPPVLRGEKIAALAITEPGGGSDVAALRTTARRDGADWVIDGEKVFITSGMRADWITVAVRTGEPQWWAWYDRIWAYSWAHMIDHTHGAWYRILTPDNRAYSDEKSPAGKTDYHTMGACHDVLRALGA